MRTKGALSRKTVKLTMFTLIYAASKKWPRLNGANQLPRVIQDVNSPTASKAAMPPRTAPFDQAASSEFSYSSDRHRVTQRYEGAK